MWWLLSCHQRKILPTWPHSWTSFHLLWWSRWRLLRQLCCDAASGMVTENRSGDGKPAVQDPGIHFEISVISTMSSCFHEFYLEPSWSSLFKTLIFSLSCWYILFLFFKQIKLIYILIFKKQVIIYDLVFLLVSQIFWNVIFFSGMALIWNQTVR